MDPKKLSLIALRAAALALQLSGNGRGSSVLLQLADAVESGLAVDEHLAAVADRLKSGAAITDADWDDVEARIRSASADLQSVGKPTG